MQLDKGKESAIRTICKDNAIDTETKVQEIMNLVFDRSGQGQGKTGLS